VYEDKALKGLHGVLPWRPKQCSVMRRGSPTRLILEQAGPMQEFVQEVGMSELAWRNLCVLVWPRGLSGSDLETSKRAMHR
jgi:hypothetical protein